MHEVWLSLKRTLECKSHPKEVHDPKANRYQRSTQRANSGKLEHSNSKGGIDIINNTITHEIEVLDGSNSEINICLCCPCAQRKRRPATPSRITHHVDYTDGNASSSNRTNTRILVQMDSDAPSNLICHKCGEKLKNLDAVEAHHISEHSVTELQEDSSRQIIETICETSSVNSENMSGQIIDHILKVHNTPKTLACFEEHREMVKIKSDRLQKKHPRCLVDGNELLRFHGTTIACSLGINNNSSYRLCTLDYCGTCHILRHGFSTNKELHGVLGVYTTSTSRKAFDSIDLSIERPFTRKSVIVCRVIAGIVYNSSPLEEIQEQVDSGFDSLAEKINGHSDIEELCLLNPKALLPCFVVIYKQQQTMRVRRFNPSFRRSF